MGNSLGGLPMCDERYRSGAVFWMSEPLSTPWDLNMQDESGRPIAHIGGAVGSPHLVVRLRGSVDGFAAARWACLHVVQRALDIVSVMSSDHLQLRSLRGEEEHLVWWESKQLGHALRYTCHSFFDPDLILAPFKLPFERVQAGIPPERIAPRAAPPPWHPSFRYFRAAQCSDDLANSFRNMYLALESVLDAVFPKAQSGLPENSWLVEAVNRAMTTSGLATRFAARSSSGSAVDHVLSIYNDKRLTTFHSKAGPDSRLPFLEDDVRHGELEQAFTDLSDLYLDLARTHLHLDRRVERVLMRGGWELVTKFLLGATDIYVTKDDAPIEERINDETLNPRGAVMHQMHTRNAAKMEGPFDRIFIGKSSPADAGHPLTIHGWTVAVNNEPFTGGTFEAPLHLDGVDQVQVVVGYSYRRPDLRVTFKS
ncbi:MAG TPA: hypothetical protein VE462_10220 [Propionibacteriaceae bacterium]|jgi:hypothetical protein|nr:hypothetical protein [Propionibacteriaceae bacterium]